ncbi:hypothetical protein ACUNV4_03580 [Granulosicoccus sp. 3-233]|uniref:hypothetical protein n=1 Tax=Granulosicoccus sp. 3-233 TaxID=3417969 RepID=UPI003D3326BB
MKCPQQKVAGAMRLSLMALSAMALTGCLASTVTQGTGGTSISGAAGGGTSAGANSTLERCDQTLGTLAVDDGSGAAWYTDFNSRTKVTTIEPLLRLAVQQSNCFVITSIGNSRTESRLSAITDKQRNSGEFRAGSNQQKGQRVAADYYMEPAIIIDESTVGKVAGGIAGILGGSALAGLAGGATSKESVVTLSLYDIRSSVQISAAEGSSSSRDYGAAVGLLGGGGAVGLGGFSRTPEGKATVAAFLDAYNGMVVSLKNYQAQEVEGGLGTGGTLKVN